MDYVSKFEIFLENEKEVSATTLSAYMSDVMEFEKFIAERNKVLEKAGNAEVAAYMMKLSREGRSSSTINRKLSSVKSFYQFLRSIGKINTDPCFGIKPPKVERKEVDYLTEDEIGLLLDSPDDTPAGIRDRAIFELLYATGIKATELCDARISDINFKIGFINVNSARPRVVPIGKPAREALKTYISQSRNKLLGDKEDKGILFLSYLGEGLTRQGIWKIMKQYGDKTGLKDKLSPQIIRNTFAAHLIMNGADLKSLQELLGHEDILATKIYLNFSKNRIMDVYDRAFPRAKMPSKNSK